jgi:hypothetical protein
MVTRKKPDDAVVVDVDVHEKKFKVKMKSWVWILTVILIAAGTLVYFLRAVIFR